jgi:tetratricopeptide (TPR) repeat protein
VSVRRQTLVMLVLLGGCATAPAPEPATVPTEPEAAQTAPAPAAEGASGATLALLRQSQRAAANGSLPEALSYAERAVRIDPRRADLWTHLASLELSNSNPQAAIQYANKALTLARDRVDQQRDAWLVIAAAHEALGDPARAAEIRDRWRTGRG